MAKQKHSPGPWHTYECRYQPKAPVYQVQIRDAKENILAVTALYGQHAGAPLREKEIIANARVLAAADELLAIAEFFNGYAKIMDTMITPQDAHWIRATITKARG